MTGQADVRVKTLKIDGRDIGARADETVLKVATENGCLRIAHWAFRFATQRQRKRIIPEGRERFCSELI